MVTKKTKKVKKRKAKGKPLSQVLDERDAARAKEDAADDDALASEPPPPVDGFAGDDEGSAGRDEDGRDEDEEDREDRDDDDRRPRDDDDDESGARDEGAAPPSSRAGGDDEEWEDDDAAAAQMGHQRYVIAGFIGLWMIAGYVLGRLLESSWSRLAAQDWFVAKLPQMAAVPHEGELISRSTISLLLGAVISGVLVLRYYYKPELRRWADEVAEQLNHVKWPTRKEVGNNTIVVLATAAVLTTYLTLLDRFWSFVTSLIYQSGT